MRINPKPEPKPKSISAFNQEFGFSTPTFTITDMNVTLKIQKFHISIIFQLNLIDYFTQISILGISMSGVSLESPYQNWRQLFKHGNIKIRIKIGSTRFG